MTAALLALAMTTLADPPRLFSSGEAVLAVWKDGYTVYSAGELPDDRTDVRSQTRILEAAPGRAKEFFVLLEREGALHVGTIKPIEGLVRMTQVPAGFVPDSMIGFTNGQALLQDGKSGVAHSQDGEAWSPEQSNRIPLVGVSVGPNLMDLMADDEWKSNGLTITVQARDGVAGALYSMRPVRAWRIDPGQLPRDADRLVGLATGDTDLAAVVFSSKGGQVMVAFYGEDGQRRRLVPLPPHGSPRDFRSIAVRTDGAIWVGRSDGRISVER
jgi:hypothetical protein